jgi:hypothetical protein
MNKPAFQRKKFVVPLVKEDGHSPKSVLRSVIEIIIASNDAEELSFLPFANKKDVDVPLNYQNGEWAEIFKSSDSKYGLAFELAIDKDSKRTKGFGCCGYNSIPDGELKVIFFKAENKEANKRIQSLQSVYDFSMLYLDGGTQDLL